MIELQKRELYKVTQLLSKIEDEDIRDYDGAEVIVTMLNCPQKKDKKAFVDAPPIQQERNHKRRR